MILRLYTLNTGRLSDSYIQLPFWLPDRGNRSKTEGRVSGGNVFGRGGLPVQKRSQNLERFPANKDVRSFVLRLVTREERFIEPDGSE